MSLKGCEASGTHAGTWTMTDSVEAYSGERGGMLFTTLQQIDLMSATVAGVKGQNDRKKKS